MLHALLFIITGESTATPLEGRDGEDSVLFRLIEG